MVFFFHKTPIYGKECSRFALRHLSAKVRIGSKEAEKPMRCTWKKVVSLALAVSLAAGIMLPAYAASAPTAPEEENAVTLSADSWYTPLARRIASTGLLGGQTSGYDTSNPYVNVNVGLFHNVPVTVDENTTGVATYYLPDGMDPWARRSLT